jgi:hypothetical protein
MMWAARGPMGAHLPSTRHEDQRRFNEEQSHPQRDADEDEDAEMSADRISKSTVQPRATFTRNTSILPEGWNNTATLASWTTTRPPAEKPEHCTTVISYGKQRAV